MLQNIGLICFILIFIYLYLYIKLEQFVVSPTLSIPTAQPDIPISTQLTSEIARVLNISKRRVTNVLFEGDVSSGVLQATFIILEPNSNELAKQEKPSKDYAIMAATLFKNGQFKVFINGIPIKLNKLKIAKDNINNFFDNTGLIDISKYTRDKYISVPNDDSLTKFYKLDIDKNFNITPKM